jgi:hypothetical protein
MENDLAQQDRCNCRLCFQERTALIPRPTEVAGEVAGGRPSRVRVPALGPGLVAATAIGRLR